MALELRNALGSAAAVQLPATLLFEYPTINALTGYIEQTVFQGDEIEDRPAEAGVRGVANQSRPSDELENLSEEEMETVLREKLAKLKR